ncbi:hypothetical protein [Pleomorphovibrio marinus]|uniref:hypothetical protein n=1 Tax=Pleomorphovibrio marinus TaxID=2164132 RepID=UPI000E0A4C52|nr:hypothetical protein [Pleomorphovibrio marinus]
MTNTLEKAIVKIEKEKINQLTFSKREVLLDEEARMLREHDLNRAQVLGNLSQGKVWITFESAAGDLYQVYTTIWAVGSAFITLKRGVVIPINAILKVE